MNMHLTYTVIGLCIFLFAGVAAAWSHSVADQCGSIIDYILLTLNNSAQQCQYAGTLYPTGIILMGIGAAVGIGGLTMKDEDEIVNARRLSEGCTAVVNRITTATTEARYQTSRRAQKKVG